MILALEIFILFTFLSLFLQSLILLFGTTHFNIVRNLYVTVFRLASSQYKRLTSLLRSII